MSTESSNSLRRERALKTARRRLRLLEIETHRIKAELARLEAEFEDDVADRLSRGWRRDRPRSERLPVDGPHHRSLDGEEFAEADAAEWSTGSASSDDFEHSRMDGPSRARRANRPYESPLPVIDVDSEGLHSPSGIAAVVEGTKSDFRRARPMMISIGIHILVLCFMLPWTVATIARPEVTLFASPAAWPDESVAELSDLEFTPAEFEGAQTEQVVIEETPTDLGANLLSDLLPLEPLAAATGEMAISDSVTTGLVDLGAMATDGELDDGAGGPGLDGPLGAMTFFGTKSQGDRFVFIVDNSSSMKDGRLEAAIAELVRSVDAMSRRQAFYVIFVSDQTYPMFYPERALDLAPATPESKQRLGQWLGKVQLAGGKNRELIKAMDMAAALRPHAVFLLWDADLRYSEAVRQDVMTHLTRPQPWNFAIHTLGMGTLSVESEQNLAAIAQAHGGTYRRIDVPRPGSR